MPIAQLALAACAVVQGGDASDHVLDRLPLAAPAGSEFVGLVLESGAASALAVPSSVGSAAGFVEIAPTAHGLDGHAGAASPIDIAAVGTSGVALDPDGDGVESWWIPDGAALQEIARGHDGAPVLGARIDLPADGARLTADGLVVVGELDQSLVGVLAAEFGVASSVEPRFVPLWIGPRRAMARVAGSATACVVDLEGEAWLVAPNSTTPIALAEAVLELRVRALANGSLELVYRAASGALRRAELDRTAGGALTGVDLALAVEDDAIDLANTWLVDADADGDADLVANENGDVVVRRGWGTSGFLAPIALMPGEARDVRIANGVAIAVTDAAIARLDADVSRVQDVPLELGAPSELGASDADHDGDTDLLAGDCVGVNDGSGSFTWMRSAEPATVVELDGITTSSFHLRDSFGHEIAIEFGAEAVTITETANGHETLVTSFFCERSSTSLLSIGTTTDASDVDANGVDANTAPAILIETRPGVVRLLQRTDQGWTLSEPRVAPVGAILADVDQDGDDDLVALAGGRLHTWFGPRYTTPDDGAFLQYGAGVAGAAECAPLLGASGPVRYSASPGRVHLVDAAPHSDLFVAVSSEPWVLDDLVGGFGTWFDRAQLAWIQGRTDEHGRWSFPLVFEPDLIGRTLHGQAHVLDARVGHVTVSNRLAVTYGR